jgi:hypothetical protein
MDSPSDYHPHPHPHHDPHAVHHSKPFEVRNVLDQTMLPHHRHEHLDHMSSDPSTFSETMRSTHSAAHSLPNSPDLHHIGKSSSSYSHTQTSSSLPSLPQIQRHIAFSRPTSGSTDPQQGHTSLTSSSAVTEASVNSVSGIAAPSANRPQSKAKGTRATSPFAHKNRYKGPERRVIDILEWARVTVGGSPKRQNRKISAVEARLLKRYSTPVYHMLYIIILSLLLTNVFISLLLFHF